MSVALRHLALHVCTFTPPGMSVALHHPACLHLYITRHVCHRQQPRHVLRQAGGVCGGRGMLLPSGRAVRVHGGILRRRRPVLAGHPARPPLHGRGPLRGQRPVSDGHQQLRHPALHVRARLLQRGQGLHAAEKPRGHLLQTRSVRREHGMHDPLRRTVRLSAGAVPGRL